MIVSIHNRLFCTPEDIQGININTLISHLHRSRKYTSAPWQNIPNPDFNGKNTRRLIAIDTIPSPYREGVMARFQLAVKDLEAGLAEEAKKENNTVVQLVNEAVSSVVKVGEAFIFSELDKYLANHWRDYATAYVERGLDSKNIMRYARTCALVQKIWNEYAPLQSTLLDKDFKRARRTLTLNLLNAIQQYPLNVAVPTSEFRLTDWVHKILLAYSPSASPYDIVEPRNAHNKNRERFTTEQKQAANNLRVQGNALPIKHIYASLLDLAKDKGWWHQGEVFSPISIETLQKHFREVDNQLAIEREGNVKYINTFVPSITRSLPTEKNAMWGTDGSPLDLLVSNGRDARQSANSIRVYDYATYRLIGIYIYKGSGEKGEHYIEALKEAIRFTGYAPKSIQFDGGSAAGELTQWCKQNGIIPMPARVGLARAKVVENLIHHFNQVLRNHPAWSGQNRTALGRNSQPSENGYKMAQKRADGFLATAYWVSTEARDQWNSRSIETLEKQPCGKSPNQLWDEKPSATTALDAMGIALLAGAHHRVKFEDDGLTIQSNHYSYTYFPNIFTEEGFKKGAEIYAKTPLKHCPESGRLSLYLTNYGDEKAYVFDKDYDKGGKYLDTWILKPKVSMVASLEGDSKILAVFLAFQKEVKQNAKNLVNEALGEQYIAPRNSIKALPRYDKVTLNNEEMIVDTSTGEVMEERPLPTRTKVIKNPITEEEHVVHEYD